MGELGERAVFEPSTTTVEVPALEEMQVSKALKRHRRRRKPGRIYHTGSNFRLCFGDMVVPTQPAMIVQFRELAHRCRDGEIIPALGGATQAETTLSQIFWLIEEQLYGRSQMLSGEVCNQFYVRDDSGHLRIVLVLWIGVVWNVYAEIIDTYLWGSGRRIFFRAPPSPQG